MRGPDTMNQSQASFFHHFEFMRSQRMKEFMVCFLAVVLYRILLFP